jgi:DNA-directed RNA polymerase subunit RPC12/RpoP
MLDDEKCAPTADVEELKHGEWVEDFMIGEGVYRCTNCDDKFVTLEGTPYDNRLFYCPFCGAKMDGGAGA